MRRENLAVLMGVGLAMAGCASSQPAQSSAPAGQPEAAPAEQPKPAADGMTHASMYYPTGDRATSSILLERAAPTEVRAGQDYEYTMKVTNISSVKLQDVVVKDNCASNYIYVSSNPEAVARLPEPLMWNLGDLAPNASKQIAVKGKATPGTNTVTNCAAVSFSSILCASSNVVEPALKVAMKAPAEASLCDNVHFTYMVTNVGTGSVRDVKVNYTLPSGWTPDKPGLSFDAGTLVAKEMKEFTIIAKPYKTGAVTGTVSAVGSGGLTAAGNTVNIVIKAPALTLDAEAPSSTYIGRDMPMKFTVKNKGDMACSNTTIAAPVPAGTTFVSADRGGTVASGTVTWDIGLLPVGDSRTVTMFAKNTGAGMVQVSAVATGVCTPAAKDTCSISVVGMPDIGTSLFDESGVVTVGDPHIFTYTVKNQGQIDLTNLIVVAELDPGLNFVSSDWPAGSTAANNNKVTWKVGTVKVGDQRIIKITCKGSKPGELQIQTATSSDQTPREIHNDEQVNYIER